MAKDRRHNFFYFFAYLLLRLVVCILASSSYYSSSMYELVCSYYARNINFNTQHACTMHTVCILRARVYMHTATLCSMHTRGVSIIDIMNNMHTLLEYSLVVFIHDVHVYAYYAYTVYSVVCTYIIHTHDVHVCVYECIQGRCTRVSIRV